MSFSIASPQKSEGPQEEQENVGGSRGNMFSIESIGATGGNKVLGSNSRNQLGGRDQMGMEGKEESSSTFTNMGPSTSDPTSVQSGSSQDASKVSNGTAGPPSNIVHRLDDDSTSLINLDSLQASELESDVSDFKITPKIEGNKTSWLKIDSSSTSHGSQGSYAHQVPTLLGPYGSNNNENNCKPNGKFLLPRHSTDKSPKCPLPDKSYSTHSNLDDILGPKGKAIPSNLSSIPSGVDDTAGIQIHDKLDDLDDIIGVHGESTIGGASVSASATNSVEDGNAGSVVNDSRLGYDDQKGVRPRTRSTRTLDDMEAFHRRNTSNIRTAEGDASTATCDVAPSESRKAVDNIGQALKDRDRMGNSSYAWSPTNSATQSSIFIEANVGENSAQFRATFETQSDFEVTEGVTRAGSTSQNSQKFAASTFESRETGFTGISQFTKTSGVYTLATSNEETTARWGDASTFANETLSPDNQSSMWESSRFSPRSYSQRTDCILSPGASDSGYSCSMRGTMTTDYSALNTDYSESEFSPRIRLNQLSTAESTQFTENGGYTPTEHTNFTQFTYDTKDVSNMMSSTSASGIASLVESGDDYASEGRSAFSPRYQISTAKSDQSSVTEDQKYTPTEHTNHTQFTYDTRATSDFVSPTSASGIASLVESGDDNASEGFSAFSPRFQISTAKSDQSSVTEDQKYTPTEHTDFTQFTYDTRATQFTYNTRATSDSASPNSASGMGSISYDVRATSDVLSPTSANGGGSKDTSRDGAISNGSQIKQTAQSQATNSKEKPLSPRAKKFTESIMARTRSRADPDALLDSASNVEAEENTTRSMININAQEEGGFIQSTGIARKRGRVIQLLIIGLISFLIAFLGGILVLSSCHFVSVAIEAEDGTEFNLHFGLWKYSPINSAFRGHTYCNHYDGDFIRGAPWFGRIASLVALAGGGFSLVVVWLYLVLGHCVQKVWRIAIFSAALSGVLQLCTLSFLVGPICSEDACTLGPASIISIIVGCFYFVLAFEMHYNAPLVNLKDNLEYIHSQEESSHTVGNLEMTDFEYGAKAYVHRIAFGNTNPYPTVKKVQYTNQHKDKGGSYVPPSAIV